MQAIVSQSLPGISPKAQIPTTPTQYSEKSRLVPSQNKFILPQNKSSASNKNPLATNSSGRLQADLSLLEASYQASLLANKQKTASNTNLHNVEVSSRNVSIVNEKTPVTGMVENSNSINQSLCNNNNVAEVGDNNLKASSETQNLTMNKWPLKPGVLVHVNSNHSLSPKNFGRTIVRANENINNFSSKNEVKENTSVTTAQENTVNKPISFDPEKCANIMKQSNAQRQSTFSRIFKKMDISNKLGKSKGDDGECLASTEKQDSKPKSNKMALSLTGFSLKDETVSKNKGIKSIFQGSKPLVVSTEGGNALQANNLLFHFICFFTPSFAYFVLFLCVVMFDILVVTYRRPPKNTHNEQNDDISKQNLINKSSNDDDLDDHDVLNQSRNCSSSRKRKKPGEGL